MKTAIICGALLFLIIACGRSDADQQTSGKASKTQEVTKEEDQMNLGHIPFATINGDTTDLSAFDGKVVLIVNVASECGYTPQYEGLEKLYEMYKDSGLVIIGFPSNDFGEQEPGTNNDILEFCKKNYGVTFPMMAKIPVLGEQKHPLFVELTEKSSIPGEIRWNFCKFLLDRSGKLVARFDTKIEPLSDEIVGEIKSLL